VPSAQLPQAGATVRLRNADYRFGEGDVTARVAEVGEPYAEPDGSQWVPLTGSRVMRNGATSPLVHTLYARVSGIGIVPMPEVTGVE